MPDECEVRGAVQRPSFRESGMPCFHPWQNELDRKESLMSEFKNVTVVKKANVYFDGRS